MYVHVCLFTCIYISQQPRFLPARLTLSARRLFAGGVGTALALYFVVRKREGTGIANRALSAVGATCQHNKQAHHYAHALVRTQQCDIYFTVVLIAHDTLTDTKY